MIRLENITKTFTPSGGIKGDNAVVALRNVSLTINEGEYVIVIGSNGSGKSTLLNTLAGTFTPDSGAIIINGKEITDQPVWKRSIHIARLFQNPLTGTAPELSVLENFRLAALRTKKKGLHIGTDTGFRISVAERVSFLGMGLENKLNMAMGSLSGGQRQALTLLMGTMDNCKVLLMDEPCSALDPRSSELIMKLADKIIREKKLTAILVTHRLRDCVEYGDRVILMAEGEIAQDFRGESKKHLTSEQLLQFF